MKPEQFELHRRIEEDHWWFVGRRRIVRGLVRLALPPSKATTVIDVGCGTGANIGALAEDYACVGMDASEDAIRFAKERYPEVEFICSASLSGLGEARGRAGLFLLMDVLEHISDDSAFLSELIAGLRPGVQLLLTVPADMSMWGPQDVHHGHFRRYDPSGLSGLWKDLPVTTRLISHFNTRLYPVIKAIRAYTRLRGQTWGEADTDLKLPGRLTNAMLERVFEGEGSRLVDLLEGRRGRGYGFGVSLIALLRKQVS